MGPRDFKMLKPLKLYTYDIETFPNCFLFTGKIVGDARIFTFEISYRKNQKQELLNHLNWLKNSDMTMVGFNSLNFDYPIIHQLLVEPWTFDAMKAYQLAQQIIQLPFGSPNPLMVWLNDRVIHQIDLVKVNHFDNQAKRLTLKALQFAMRSESVEDLPFPVGTDLNDEQIDKFMIPYNIHDVTETEKFLLKCMGAIELRKELLDTGTLQGDVLNYSDVKIGEQILVKRLGRAKCYEGKKPRQSFRSEVRFKDVILPKIYFRTEPFQAVLDWFKSTTVYISAEEQPKFETKLAGIKFKFGLGGVHASVEKKIYHSTETHIIKDIDVAGMYVAVALANGFYPEHLGREFSEAYRQLQKDRSLYPKKSTMNLVLKLAGNGVYGNSNQKYSCFYDPKYTFSVTGNGQLQLLQLVESLSFIQGLEIIQANTDGITAYVPRHLSHWFDFFKSEWERETGYKLEEVEYKSMFIRDVNNYIAVDTKGEVKRKGEYEFKVKDEEYWGGSGSEWHKNFSNYSAPKAVEQVLLYDKNPEHVLRSMGDKFDFMLRYKTPAKSKVYIGDREQPKTIRYYVSKNGEPMKKVSPPSEKQGAIGSWKRKNGVKDDFFRQVLAEIPEGQWDARIHTKNKSKVEIVERAIESGYKVKECNHVNGFDWADLDYEYYVDQVKKLVLK